MARRYVNTTPSSPEELADALSDPAEAARLFGNTAEHWREFQAAYSQRATANDPVLAQLAEADRLRAGRNAPLDFTNSTARTVAMRSPVAPGAALNSTLTTLGEIVQAGAEQHPTAELAGKLSRLSNSFSSTVPADGGFLVPEQFRSDIQSLALESAIVRPRASVMPMSSLRLTVPAVDDTSHASSVFGGLVGYWTEEGASLTESQASFERVVLEAKKLVVYGEVPNELLADSPALDAFFRMSFSQATGFYEDAGYLRGSGVGEPLGLINCPAAVTVAKESGQTAATIVWENVVKMYARMLPASLGRAVWLASPGCFPELATMALSVGTGGSAIWGLNGAQTAPTGILGRPLIFSEQIPDLGTSGQLCFADLGYYLIGDRQQMALTVSEHYKFGNDKTAVRMIERVDGRPWIQSAITPKNGGSTLSPFVQLAA